MDVVLKSNHHVKLLLNRFTPALPVLLQPCCVRVNETLTELFPQDTTNWTRIQPVEKIVLCISRSITFIAFGSPVCDDPEIIRAFMEHTKNGKHQTRLLSSYL